MMNDNNNTSPQTACPVCHESFYAYNKYLSDIMSEHYWWHKLEQLAKVTDMLVKSPEDDTIVNSDAPSDRSGRV